MEDTKVRKKRGPYKTYLSRPWLPVPRRTLYNWKKKETHRCSASLGQEKYDNGIQDMDNHTAAEIQGNQEEVEPLRSVHGSKDSCISVSDGFEYAPVFDIEGYDENKIFETHSTGSVVDEEVRPMTMSPLDSENESRPNSPDSNSEDNASTIDQDILDNIDVYSSKNECDRSGLLQFDSENETTSELVADINPMQSDNHTSNYNVLSDIGKCAHEHLDAQLGKNILVGAEPNYSCDSDLEHLFSKLELGKEWWEDTRETTERYADDESHDEDSDDDDVDEVSAAAGSKDGIKLSPAGCHDDESDKPLYPGAPITLAVSMLLIITYSVRHGLNGVALADLLTLIQLHCVTPNLCKKSVKCLKQFFMALKDPLEYHYYCPHCKEYIGKTITDPYFCMTCNTETRKRNQKYFIVIPVREQLQRLVIGEGFMDHLKYPVTRKKRTPENLEDLQDGRLYKLHFGDDGFFHGTNKDVKCNEKHLSLQVNTDGVAIFRASSFEVWPVYITINELPPHLRYQRRHRIFAGLWFGRGKPEFRTFMEPFFYQLKDFYENGAEIKLPDGSNKLFRCILLSATLDAPARCQFQCFQQFNGYFGCPCCLSPGTHFKTGVRSGTHVYPFDFDAVPYGHGEKRTHNQTIDFADQASDIYKETGKKVHVNGVKGFSWFLFCPKFDLIRGVALDYMHMVVLGVMKMLISIWLDKGNKDKSFYLGEKLNIIDSRLLQIKPPNIVTRLPRSIAKELKHWKASEFRTFLLFYSIPCLYGLLPDEYFQHALLLFNSIALLLQTSIPPLDLDKAENMLRHFCLSFGRLYSPRYETSNLHGLLHLVDKCRDHGQLWTTSCFWYEDFNGDIRKLFHGTQNVDFQAMFAISLQQKIPELLPFFKQGTAALEFYKHLTTKRKSTRHRLLISSGVYAIGVFRSVPLTGTPHMFISSLLGPVQQIKKFTRLEMKGKMLHSREYKRASSRNSYTVRFFDKNGTTQYGFVEFYAHCIKTCPNRTFCSSVCSCKFPVFVALISRLKKKNGFHISLNDLQDRESNHIIPVEKRGTVTEAVRMDAIQELCFFLDLTDNLSFVAKFPNMLEKD